MPVLGIVTEDIKTIPETIGASASGGLFCDPDGFCDCEPSQVLVGFTGGFRSNTSVPGLVQLSAICAPLAFLDNGVAERGTPTATESFGSFAADNGAITTLECPPGSAVGGIRGLDTMTFAGALALDCVAIRHVEGRLNVGILFAVGGRLGTSGNLDQVTPCAVGEVAVGMHGAAGEVVDRVGLRCASLSSMLQ